MKKIIDLTEKRFRTSYIKDAYGNRKKVTEEYTAKRAVKTVDAGPRFGHFIIDVICFQIIMIAVDYLLTLAILISGKDMMVGLVISVIAQLVALLLWPVLYFICEYKWQRTPGKYLTKTIVIDEYGNKPDLRTVALRSLIRIVPFEPFSCLGDNSHGWHDRWSETFVVKLSELEELKRLQLEQSGGVTKQ